MSRFELRWIGRHPLRWLRLMWLPWTLAAVLLGLAWIVRDPLYDVLRGASLWPLLLSATAGAIAMSALAPLDERVQAVTGGLLVGLATLRVITLGVAATQMDGNARTLAVDLGLHWIVLLAVGAAWPRYLRSVGRVLTVAAGEDDRG